VSLRRTGLAFLLALVPLAARCRTWAGLSSVKTVAARYRATLAVTRVTGTCYLRRQPLGPTQDIAVD
jgi:hypothetical protein